MKKVTLFLLALFLCFGLCACKDTKELTSIAVDVSALPETQYAGEVSLSGAKLVLNFADGSRSVIDLTEDCFDPTSYALLQAEGEQTFTVHYLGKTATFSLKILPKQPPQREYFTGIVFEGATVPYDGKEHSLYAQNVPEGADVEYRYNGQSEVGSHEVICVVTQIGYEPLLLRATLVITAE